MKALIATFYKDLKMAKKNAQKSQVILSFPNGYLVVSERQVKWRSDTLRKTT